jgi:ABC-type phosphate transport system ATPase subunit
VALALALALCPAVLLLDEPTSACDPASALKVEQVLRGSGAAIIWVTHDAQQAARVGGRAFELPRGVEVSLPRPAAGG